MLDLTEDTFTYMHLLTTPTIGFIIAESWALVQSDWTSSRVLVFNKEL